MKKQSHQGASSPYITPQGHARLKEELQDLWRRLRPEVTRALTAAAAEGDRSENAEYIYLNGDGTVNTVDLLALLAAWGPCDPGCCIADLDIDGAVSTTDLLILLANWT